MTVTDIRYTYYKDSAKILGQTFGMLVLQDYEAITPNLLARTIETVEGGGIVVLLLKTMSSLKQLYAMAMVSFNVGMAWNNLISHDFSYRTFTPDTGQTPTSLFNPVSMNDSSFLSAQIQIVSFSTMNSTFYLFPRARIFK